MSGSHHDSHQDSTESYAALRTKALEALLVEKGLITTDVIDTVVRAYEQDIGPLNNARQLQIVHEHVDDALAKGAKLLAGGRRIEDWRTRCRLLRTPMFRLLRKGSGQRTLV